MLNDLYKIKIISSGIAYKLKINGVALVDMTTDSNFSSFFTINEWLNMGPNTIELDIDTNEYPITGASTIDITLGKVEDYTSEIHEVKFELKAPYMLTQPPQKKSGVFMIEHLNTSLFLLDLPIIDITETKYISQLYSKMQDLYNKFKTKDEKGLLEFTKFRHDEYDLIYDQTLNQASSQFLRVLEKVFTKEDMLLFKPEELRPNIHALSKLLTLDYNAYKLPAINSTFKGQSTRTFQFYWALDESSDELFIYR